MVLKMTGLAPQNYIKDSYNCFDATVVALSILDWVIEETVDKE